MSNLLVFINAHLAFNHANQVAVLASHSHKTQWLYPTPASQKRLTKRRSAPNGTDRDGDIPMMNGAAANGDDEDRASSSANKYGPFYAVESELIANLDALIASTSPSDLAATTTTMIAGALTTALTFISKQTELLNPGGVGSSDPSAAAGGTLSAADGGEAGAGSQRQSLTSRILVLSVSGDLASQYIPVMNAIFAAQRLRIPIDILKLAGDTVFLQQASDATGGVYIAPSFQAAAAGGDPPSIPGLLQFLMMVFLPDATARRSLVPPSVGAVDFRAACFCHRRVVDIGFVCSVCLSIFCEPPMVEGGGGAACLTCGSPLELSKAVTAAPAVIPRRKKKKKRAPGEAGTPGPGTPVPS